MAAKGNDLQKSQSNKEYKAMVRRVELYKKCTSVCSMILMFGAMVFMLGVLGFNFYKLNDGHFYLSRTRREVTKVIDFESITTNEVKYFLYRNSTVGAMDAGAENNFFIVSDAERECNYDGVYFEGNPNRILTIRNNVYKTYMLVSEIYVFIIMIVLLIMAVFIIPFKMREHHIPVIFRSANENMFSVQMRARNTALMIFIALSGSLTHLTNYFVEDICLHTVKNPKVISAFDVNMTDYYQYCLVSLVWFSSFPMVAYSVANFFKDVSRYIFIPFIVTGIVFMYFAVFISGISLFNIMFNGNSPWTRWAVYTEFIIYMICEVFVRIYSWKFAKRDLLRTEEEEIEA